MTHIESVSGKIGKTLGLLRHIKSCLPLSARVTFFSSFILPLFDYGDIIWGGRGNATLMSELQVLQNEAAHLILDLPAHSSASGALKRLGWKPLVHGRMEHHAVFLYKLLNNNFCQTVPILFNGDFHGYYTTSRNNICKSTANRKWGHWSSINFSSEI